MSTEADPQSAAQMILDGSFDGQPLLPFSNTPFWRKVTTEVRLLAPSPEACEAALRGCMSYAMGRSQGAANALVGPVCDTLIQDDNTSGILSILGEVLDTFPKSIRARLQMSKALFRTGALEAARDELAAMLPARDRETAITVLRQALSYRAWDTVEALLDLPLVQRESQGELADFIASANALRTLDRSRRAGDAEPGSHVICINLDRDSHRIRGARATYAELGCAIDRHSGVFGASVPEVLYKRIFRWNCATNAVGCCLSHVGVWEKVAKGPADHVLVLEDDGLPMYDFDIAEVSSIIPADYDYCFVNDRANPDWYRHTPLQQRFAPLAEALQNLPPETRAPGADGYILSRRGAAKLLEIVDSHGLLFSLDWYLMALAAPEEAAGSETHVSRIFAKIRKPLPADLRTNAYVASIPLVSHQPQGFTARAHFA